MESDAKIIFLVLFLIAVVLLLFIYYDVNLRRLSTFIEVTFCIPDYEILMKRFHFCNYTQVRSLH